MVYVWLVCAQASILSWTRRSTVQITPVIFSMDRVDPRKQLSLIRTTHPMSKKRIVVCGGNGFLGTRICKSAATRNWDVISISRSGAPTWSAVTSSPSPPPWASSVQWEKGDILKPATYRKHLKDADAVVHSMGILLEADYKGVLTGKESVWSGLQRAFSQTKAGSQANPLERGMEGEGELKSGEGDGQITYELMNRDSGMEAFYSAAWTLLRV